MYAFGGIPIKEVDGRHTLLGNAVDEKFLGDLVTESLGLSGMMTFANKSDMTLQAMGSRAGVLGHDWGLNWITVSFLVNDDEAVELSLLRHRKFYQSWTVGQRGTFGITGSVKDFAKYSSHFNDNDFDKPTRDFMRELLNFKFLWDVH